MRTALHGRGHPASEEHQNLQGPVLNGAMQSGGTTYSKQAEQSRCG